MCLVSRTFQVLTCKPYPSGIYFFKANNGKMCEIAQKMCETPQSRKVCGNCVFPQNVHTRKLGEISVFQAMFECISSFVSVGFITNMAVAILISNVFMGYRKTSGMKWIENCIFFTFLTHVFPMYPFSSP